VGIVIDQVGRDAVAWPMPMEVVEAEGWMVNKRQCNGCAVYTDADILSDQTAEQLAAAGSGNQSD